VKKPLGGIIHIDPPPLPVEPKVVKRVGINGRDKGNGFENKIAKRLGDWSETPWRRVPLSGGWDKTIISGDVFCIEEYERKKSTDHSQHICVPLSFECKCDESWDFLQLFNNSEKAPIKVWWKQASDDAIKAKKEPSLVFTKNYTPIFIVIKRSTLDKLNKFNIAGGRPSWTNLSYLLFPMSSTTSVVFFRLDTFLSWIDFPTLLKLSKV